MTNLSKVLNVDAELFVLREIDAGAREQVD